MDILVISNIFNKFSGIFLNNEKTEIDIETLTEFLEDPFNLDIEHLNYFYNQIGGKKFGIPFGRKTGGVAEALPGAEVAGGVAEVAGDPAAEAAKVLTGAGGLDPEDVIQPVETVDPGALAGALPGEGANSENNKSEEDRGNMARIRAALGDIKNDVSAGNPEDESKLMKLINFMVKILIYPLLFIFLIIFPYIYVTYASFKKLLKSYRKNVLTV